MIRYPRALSFAWSLMLIGLIACNMVNSPASPPTAAPTPIVRTATATAQPPVTLAPLPTSVPPTQRPPAATSVPPATIPAQPPSTNPNPALCYFYPYGVNGSTITLYIGPSEINPLGATITAAQFLVATLQSGSWIRVRSEINEEGWIQLERGNLGGNCANLPQQAGAQECRATANINQTIYVLPDISSMPFGMTLVASASVPVIVRSNGFLGFDPGVNWIPPNITGNDRLRWITPDNVTLTGACDNLPTIPQSECRVTANADQTVYVLPDSNSMPFPFTFTATSSVVATANNNGYFGFDPGVNGVPANVTGPNRLRWIAPGNVTLSGSCDNLPSVVIQ